MYMSSYITKDETPHYLQNAGPKITEFFYNCINNNKIRDITLNILEQYCEKHISSSISVFNVLFLKDEHDCNLIYYICLEDREKLIDEIFTKYSLELKRIPEKEWNLIFLEKNLYLQNKIKTLYGDKYYNNIGNYINNDDVQNYHPTHLSKLLKANKLDNFFQTYPIDKLMNKPDFDLSNFWLFIHTFTAQQESYIKYLSNPKNIHLKLPIFKRQEKQDVTYYSIRIPDKSELNTFVFNYFGNKKGNTILKEFLEMNHNTLNLLIENSNKNNKSNAENKNSPFKDIKMESNEFFNFFTNGKLNKKLLMSVIMPYLNKEPELLSHFIINDLIDKEDLLFNIKNPNFIKNDEFIVLNEKLPITQNKTKKTNKI